MMLQAGSVKASVNISTIDDQDTECDEIFTAEIIIGGDGNSRDERFRPGPISSTSITVKDNEGDLAIAHKLHHYLCTIYA